MGGRGYIRALKSFLESKAYIVLVAGLILLGHTTVGSGERLLFGGYQEFIFGGIMFLTMFAGCLICDDSRFLMMPFISFIFLVPVEHTPNVPSFSHFYIEPVPLTITLVLAVILIGCMVWFMARNRNRAKRIPFGKPIFLSMAVFCGALFLNGAFSSYYTVSDTVYPISFVLSMLAVYALFASYTRFDRTAFDYFMTCLVTAGLLICAELLLAYATGGVRFRDGIVDKGSVALGWGLSTAIGGMLAFLMPACFYFAHSHRYGWFFYLLGLLEYGCVVLAQSRGGLLTGTVVLVMSLVCLCVSGKNRKHNWIFTGVLVAVGLISFAALHGKQIGILQNYLTAGLDDHGRFAYWKQGWKNFTDFPVFGAGFYDSFFYPNWQKDVYPYLYHNTPIQLLASGGIAAFGAYCYHRFCTVRLCFRGPNVRKTFLGFCMLALIFFSLFDVLFFNTYPTIIYALMLLFMEKSDDMPEVVCSGGLVHPVNADEDEMKKTVDKI